MILGLNRLGNTKEFNISNKPRVQKKVLQLIPGFCGGVSTILFFYPYFERFIMILKIYFPGLHLWKIVAVFGKIPF
jgi:hypothetical protein